MIIVGAGVTGLAAAGELVRRGARVEVLEARDRIGGRVLTTVPEGLSIPVELGAEFVHGLAPETLALAREHRLAIVEVPDRRYRAQRGRVRPYPDYWSDMKRGVAALDPEREDDRSVAEAIRGLDAGARGALLDYVAGLEAADPVLHSERALAEAEQDGGTDHRQLRLVGGYAPLVGAVAQGARGMVELHHAVTAIRWKRGRVEVTLTHGRSTAVRVARACVVTAPIGVLHAPLGSPGGIAIDPLPAPARRALMGLAMGHAVRLVLQLDAPLEDLVGAPAGFVHTRSGPFHAWWSPSPVRERIVVAWAGGPRARALEPLDPDALVERARRALIEELGVAPRHARIASAFVHAWQRDPWSRGVYAYPLVGGATAARRLARPNEGTLFFAGEALDGEHPGTVEGALAEGRRVAGAVLDALE